jgi:hypothetical protein
MRANSQSFYENRATRPICTRQAIRLTLRESYESAFQQALEATHCAEASGQLLSLVQLMMLFMAAYYPSFLSFSRESAASS